MINVPNGVRILLAAQPVDFCKGAHGLAALAQEVLAEDPFSGAVIVYCSKRADRVKILLWDGSGLVLVWKQMRALNAERQKEMVSDADKLLKLTAGDGQRLA